MPRSEFRPPDPAIRRVFRTDDGKLTTHTDFRHHGSVTPRMRVRARVVRRGHITAHERTPDRRKRCGHLANVVELLRTVLTVRDMLDGRIDATGKHLPYARPRLIGIYDAKGNLLNFLTNVVRHNARRNGFTGERLLRRYPVLVDQAHTWAKIEVELA